MAATLFSCRLTRHQGLSHLRMHTATDLQVFILSQIVATVLLHYVLAARLEQCTAAAVCELRGCAKRHSASCLLQPECKLPANLLVGLVATCMTCLFVSVSVCL